MRQTIDIMLQQQTTSNPSVEDNPNLSINLFATSKRGVTASRISLFRLPCLQPAPATTGLLTKSLSSRNFVWSHTTRWRRRLRVLRRLGNRIVTDNPAEGLCGSVS